MTEDEEDKACRRFRLGLYHETARAYLDLDKLPPSEDRQNRAREAFHRAEALIGQVTDPTAPHLWEYAYSVENLREHLREMF